MFRQIRTILSCGPVGDKTSQGLEFKRFLSAVNEKETRVICRERLSFAAGGRVKREVWEGESRQDPRMWAFAWPVYAILGNFTAYSGHNLGM